MKIAVLLFTIAGLLTGCGRTENANQTNVDSTATATPKPKNCLSVVDTNKLGKNDEYKESTKPYKFTLTLEQDSTSLETGSTCFFDNKITVLATKKSGEQVFKRTLIKDDLRYYIKDAAVLEHTVLQQTTYQPTFNSQRYIVLQMRLIEPSTKQTTDFTVSMNYHGEIVKVK